MLKQAFFKTDCSTGGIGHILMQVEYSPQSLVALKLLEDTGEYTFDLSLDCLRICLMFF